jgi:pilus assembly protein CpaD
LSDRKEHIEMSKALKLALAALVFTTSACGTENRSVDSVHKPVVQRADYVIDLGIGGDGLAAGEVQRLSGWLETLRVAYGDRISIDMADGYVPDTVRGSVDAVAARYGMLVSTGAPVTAGEIPAGAARVVLSRIVASAPGCPDWTRPAVPDLNANLMSNYGCATNSNHAAMIANPNDLLEGREATGGASILQTKKAIDAYRRASPTGNGNTVRSEGVGN